MNILLAAASGVGDVLAVLPLDNIPNPQAEMPPGMGGLKTIMNWVKWISLAICVIGLMAAGAMMAIQSRRGEGGEHVGKIGSALGGVVLISAATAMVTYLAGA